MSADPLHLDANALRALASDAIVRRGVGYFKENRVVDLGWEAGRLWAQVQGSRPDLPYQVQIDVDGDGELLLGCDCPFDAEPACKHAIAALMGYAARQAPPDALLQDASDVAIEDRAKRGRTEVVVEHLSGDPWFGLWRARSIGDGRGPGRERNVAIRSLTERINTCSCPDFSTNRLGTCKHIEAVLHQLRKCDPDRFRTMTAHGPPGGVVTLAWNVPDAPIVRLQRPRRDPGMLAEWCDADGRLTRRLPDDLHGLQREAAGRDDVWIGEDVVEHGRKLAEQAAHAVRGRQIREEILRSGGRLPGITARLYPYQVEGVAFLAGNGRALLADDMGLGKTLQAIAAATWLIHHNDVARVLVVCPASLKHNWKREISKFAGLDAEIVGGSAAARLAQYRRRAKFTVLNYEIAVRDREVLQRELAPDLLVLDEAQRLKNWRTRTADAVKSLTARFGFVLTGTPLENRLEDLYSVMQIVDPRVLGPLWRFLIDFHVTDDRGKVLGYRNLTELRRRLAPVMLRRDRAIVRDQLPDRTETRRDLPMDPRQRDLHDGALAAAATIARIAKRRPLTPTEEHRLMSSLQSARMACDAAGLVDGETIGSPKLDELGRLLEELCIDGGQKVVVFSQWERMGAMAEDVARGLGLGVARLHGSVPTGARGALIDRFTDDPEVQVFISTDAGGVGLNLQVATALINLDLPWNPAVLDQRIARIHRLGQKRPVQAILLVAEASYEAQIAVLIASKRDLFRHAVTDEATDDVVGVSKRMVESAIAMLDTVADKAKATEVEPAARPDEPVDSPVVEPAAPPVPPEPTDTTDTSLAPLLAALQAALGSRIERIVASGGGLVVVVDAADPIADDAAARAGGDVPIAIVPARTWAALARLGVAPGAAAALWERPAGPPPMLSEARRKLDAAEALLVASCGGEAVEMATRAMLLVAAERAGASVPDVAGAALWLYTEVVPKGLITAEDAGCIGRALALATVPFLPVELARAVVADAARVVGAA